MHIEQIYALESYAANLILAKIAYDNGISNLHSINLRTYEDFGGNDDGYFQNFITVLGKLFQELDYAPAYEDYWKASKEQWLTLTPFLKDDMESLAVIRIASYQVSSCDQQVYEDEFSKVFQSDNDLLIVFETDFGIPDCSMLLSWLMNHTKREVSDNEMAI